MIYYTILFKYVTKLLFILFHFYTILLNKMIVITRNKKKIIFMFK